MKLETTGSKVTKSLNIRKTWVLQTCLRLLKVKYTITQNVLFFVERLVSNRLRIKIV